MFIQLMSVIRVNTSIVHKSKNGKYKQQVAFAMDMVKALMKMAHYHFQLESKGMVHRTGYRGRAQAIKKSY